MTKQTIKDDGRAHKYFHIIPNMADDDLDPFQYRLYGHYKRVCGDTGTCDESVRQTAEATKMSRVKVQKARDELESLGYLKVVKPTPQEARKGKTVQVSLIDRWVDNVYRYAKPVSDLVQPNDGGVLEIVQPVSEIVQQAPEAVSDLVHLKEDREEPLKKPRVRNPWYDVIHSVWGHTGGRNADMEKMLRGISNKPKYAEYNMDTPVADPQFLLSWKAWYLKTKNTRADAILPSRPETVQSSVGEYQAFVERRKAAQIIPLTTEKITPMPASADEWLAEFREGMDKTS